MTTLPPARSADDRPSAPVRVLALAGRILADTGRGLFRCWWQLLGLAAFSFILHHLLIDLGARVAVNNGPAGMALLVLAVTVRLVLIAVMVLVAAAHIEIRGRRLVTVDLFRFLDDPDRLDEAPDRSPRLRDQLGTFVTALGPLVLLYAAWQLINNDLHQFLIRLFGNAMATPDQTNNSNINFNEGWTAYIVWAIAVWLVKIILERIRRRWRRGFLDLLIVYAEVGWILLAWLVVTSVLGRIRSWWRSRELVSWWRQGVDRLGAIIPVDLDLPAIIDTVTAAITAVLSVLFFQLAQPMVWVAVVALVLGWGRSESSLVHRSRVAEVVQQRWTGTSRRRRFALEAATGGMREKYVPVLAVLRLMWRSGPLPILTVGALYVIGGLFADWIGSAVVSLADPYGELAESTAETVRRSVRFLLEPVRICFLVATFAEVLRLRTEQVAPAQRAKR